MQTPLKDERKCKDASRRKRNTKRQRHGKLPAMSGRRRECGGDRGQIGGPEEARENGRGAQAEEQQLARVTAVATTVLEQ